MESPLAWILLVSLLFANVASASNYQDDPKILAILDALGDRTSTLLPDVISDCGDETLYGCNIYGPASRDYSNKMVYAPERRTALYAGGSHGTLRSNDVWEFHLGSNTWHMIFAPDGGNHALLKGPLYYHAYPKLTKDPNAKLSEKERVQFEKARVWWKENAVFRDGHVVTRANGPIMPSHTWDGFTYDHAARKLIWTLGAGPGSDPKYHGLMAGVEPVKGDPNYTNMWTFDPASRKWSHYRTEKPRPGMRGMGATLCFVPDLKKSIYYVAARNVVPQDFEMWTYDAVADHWNQLHPNEGRSISDLVGKDDVAPLAEQQIAYSQKDKMLVAVRGPNTYGYDIATNVWSKLCHDERIDGHDARTVFAYDSVGDVFLLAHPRKHQLAAFGVAEGKWEVVEPNGPGFPKVQYGAGRGYYDPEHNVFVVHNGHARKLWVYRHKRANRTPTQE